MVGVTAPLLLAAPVVAQDVDSVEAPEGFVSPLDHASLCRTDPDAGVIVLLVGLVLAFRIANLSTIEK